MTQRTSGRLHGLEVGRPVEVLHGSLAGMSGVLIGFTPERTCQIELDTVEPGVLLLIAPEAVRARPLAGAKTQARLIRAEAT